MENKPRLLFCQTCGMSQHVETGKPVHVCESCGGGRFHTLHPAAINTLWRWPGPTKYDRRFLRALNICWEAK